MVERVGEHWNRWQRRRDDSAGAWTEWSDHPRILANLQRELFGSESTTVFDHLRRRYPGFARARSLSLCAGDGAFERLLVEQGVFGSVVGIDLADERVAAANAARGALADRMEFTVGDANRGDFGEADFDIVFAKAALHHIAELESMIAGVRRALRHGGHLVTIDFFGPTRFQWTDAQLDEANRFLRQHVPERLRVRADGSVLTRIERPAPEQVSAVDPSEAIRSAELHGFLRARMSIVEELPLGGTLLNLVFDGNIVNNFGLDDAAAMDVIDRACAYERELIRRGTIDSDFRLIVARFPSGSGCGV